MNKHDCEEIGLNLAALMTNSTDLDGFIDSICALDPRIRGEYEAFRELQLDEESLYDDANKEMERRYGHMWACIKNSAVKYKEVVEELKNNKIYDNNY